MPPRRRRAGFRAAAQLSPELQAAIDAEVERLQRLEVTDGPVAVIDAVGDTFVALDVAFEAVADRRLHAIAHLRREGWSSNQIEAATTLSKSRVVQLMRVARQRGY